MMLRARFMFIALILPLLAARASAEDAVSVEIAEADGEAVLVVRGLPQEALDRLPSGESHRAERAKLLEVYVGEEPGEGLPPVLGTVERMKDQVVFRPRFPLRPGMAYRVVLSPQLLGHPSADGDVPDALVHIVRVAEEKEREPAIVAAVYPTGDVLPENLLKFYVHFSAPMRQGDVYDHVRIVDESGKEADHPFVNVGQELWDRSGTRITLLLDPGRIKRGLRPREELGPILHAGRRYEFVIDGAWKDAHGRPLGETYRKAFRVAAPDDVQPDPAKWEIDAPAANTTSPLAIKFAEPLDHALLFSSFTVFDEHDREVAGRIQVDDGETLWRFVPRSEWAAGGYRVVVEATLEDRAGNSIEKPFEVDVFERVQTKVTKKHVSVPFRIRQ